MTTMDVIEQVVLVKGRILHAGSGEPIVGRIWITSPQGWVTDRQKHWIGHKIFPDGKFVVFDQLNRLFPKLEKQGYLLTLKIHVDSPQFRKRPLTHEIKVNVPQAHDFSVPFDEGSIVLPLSEKERKQAIALTLRGYVTEDRKLDQPIAQAEVEILHKGDTIPLEKTNQKGLYEFKDIVVLGPAKIRCSATNHNEQKRRLFIDFAKAIYQGHREDFRLVKKPGTKK